MERRVLLLINTKSGRIRPRRTLRVLRGELDAQGISYSWRCSGKVSELAQIAADAESGGFTEVAVWGGDGTISRVAERLADSRIILTVLPGGTGNILARYLDIPMNLRGAAKSMLNGREVRSLDGLQIGGQIFFLNISLGMSSLTITQLKSRAKRMFGLLSYVGGLVVHFFQLDPFDFSIRADGIDSIVRGRELILCSTGFMNTPVASIFRNSDPFDGTMECYILTVQSAGDFICMIADLITGRLKRTETYLWKTEFTREISISNLPRLPIQADGDKIRPKELRVRVRKGTVRIRVPESQSDIQSN